jgi:Spy/CpxP family protein refolding chaperone
MRSVCQTFLALGVACLLVQPLLAQEGGGQGRGRGRGGFGGGMMGPTALLQMPTVQKELNLTEDQITKVKDVGKQIQDKHKDDQAAIRELPREERGEKQQNLMKTESDEATKALGDVLKPEQMKRYKQIQLQMQVQMRGPQAFEDPDVASALKLTDDQKDKIKTLAEDYNKEMAELRPSRRGGQGGGGGGGGGGGAAGGNREKIATLRKETMDKVQAVLTDDQKKQWTDMTGSPFEMPRFGGRRGQGGGGGGGGGGR